MLILSDHILAVLLLFSISAAILACVVALISIVKVLALEKSTHKVEYVQSPFSMPLSSGDKPYRPAKSNLVSEGEIKSVDPEKFDKSQNDFWKTL